MAVYTEVSDEELSAYLAEYDLGELLACKGIAEGVENSNFLLHTDAGFYILTLYEKRVDTNDLPFFLGLMEHLAQRGITCPQPVHARNGAALGMLAGRPAVIVTFLDGLSVRHPSPAQCGMLGNAMAGLHVASSDFTIARKNAMAIDSWFAMFKQAGQQADSVFPNLAQLVSDELAFLRAHWPADLPTGVIHADLFPDNVFFRSGHLSGLIDFYFACNDFLAYDLMISMNAWCFEPDGSFNVTAAMAMLEQYQNTRALTDAEIRALPVLARGAALRFLLTRLVDWLDVPEGALVKPKDPLEYMRKLRFHQQIISASEYGLQA
jgi:homoserine kinase type II